MWLYLFISRKRYQDLEIQPIIDLIPKGRPIPSEYDVMFPCEAKFESMVNVCSVEWVKSVYSDEG